MAICDINYDNLFSFSSWADSPSSKAHSDCAGNGTFTVNKTNGTVISQGTGDFYTNYWQNDFTALYYIPVQAGQPYTLRFDADNVGGLQIYVFYVNDQYAAVPQPTNYGNWFNGTYYTNVLHFTPPSGCTKITFRIGTINGVRTTFSNIAIYKDSWITYSTTNRQYRKTFESGVPLGALYLPQRQGYSFQGWFTGENGTGSLFNKDTVLGSSVTVYSHWKKKDYVDTNYDNLFSFCDWYYSRSGSGAIVEGSNSGNISADINTGTITVNSAGTGAIYTQYGLWLPHYFIRVEPNQQYIFEYNAFDNNGAVTSGIQAFVFFTNENEENVEVPGKPGWYFEMTDTGKHIEFTTPSNCTRVCFRLGINSGVGTRTVKFNKIALRKKSFDYEYSGFTSVRVKQTQGELVSTVLIPAREGYEFKGWYTGENGTGQKVDYNYRIYDSISVYSAWRINDVYGRASLSKENYVGDTPVKEIYRGMTKVYEQ